MVVEPYTYQFQTLQVWLVLLHTVGRSQHSIATRLPEQRAALVSTQDLLHRTGPPSGARKRARTLDDPSKIIPDKTVPGLGTMSFSIDRPVRELEQRHAHDAVRLCGRLTMDASTGAAYRL